MADSTQVGSLHYDLDIPTDKLEGSLDSADKSVKKFGDNVGVTADQIKNTLNKVAVGFGVVGAGLGLLAKNATDFTVDLVKDSKGLAREIGVTVTEASRLTAAFGRLGVSSEQARSSFGIFSKNIAAATENANTNRLAVDKLKLQIERTKQEIVETTDEIKKHGTKSAELDLKLRTLTSTLAQQEDQLSKNADGFSKLGISTKDAEGKQKDFTTILFEVADKFKAMPAGIDKTALALELFGRSGKDMIKILDLGGQGIQELEKRADELGLTLNEKTITRVNDFVKSQKELKQSTDALKIQIGTTTAPVLTEFNRKINDIVSSLLQADGPIRDVTVGFIAFGGPVSAAIAGAAAFLANVVQLAPALKKVADALKITAAAQLLLNFAMGISPIVWFSLAVGALIGAFVLLYTKVDGFREIVNQVFHSVVESVSWAVSSIVGFFETLPKRIGDFIGAVADIITAPFRAGFKAIVGLWNNTVGRIGFKAPSWVPGIGGKGWSFPRFAEGAIATGPTVGMFGEAGTEAVLPLSFLDRYNNLFDRIENVSKSLAGSKGEQRQGDFVVNIGTIEDRQDAQYVVDEVNRNQARLSMGISPSMGV